MIIAYRRARERMIQEQLVSRGINDPRVLRAMAKVPRHLFLESELWDQAYKDHPLPIGADQTISQPYMVALMAQALELKGAERVLEVGTGSGYAAAVLSELCAEIFTVEAVARACLESPHPLEQLGLQERVGSRGRRDPWLGGACSLRRSYHFCCCTLYSPPAS